MCVDKIAFSYMSIIDDTTTQIQLVEIVKITITIQTKAKYL